MNKNKRLLKNPNLFFLKQLGIHFYIACNKAPI